MFHLPEVTTPIHCIDKVKPFLHTLITTFQSIFYPGCEVSIDETMIGFKGIVIFLQYCPKKPTKQGLKAYVLAGSETGYICNILPYTGGETRDTYLSHCKSDLPLYTHIGVALLDKYLDKGHHVYADRFYSSVNLIDELDKRETGYTGTLVRSRKLLPKVVRGKKFKLEKGEMKAWRDGKKMVMAWRDKGKPTVLISSVHPASTTTV